VSFGDFGAGALRAALLLSLWGFAAAAYAAWKRDARALTSARAVAVAAFLLILGADLAMVGALVTHDFSLVYVAENNARATPLFYSAISLWAALAGSILLWTLILAGAVAIPTMPVEVSTSTTSHFGNAKPRSSRVRSQPRNGLA